LRRLLPRGWLQPSAILSTWSARSEFPTAVSVAALSARHLSVGVVLAPVMDVRSLPGNPITGTRCFSDDPDLVVRLGLAFVEGVQEEGVIACAKHYPGHGDTERDSHVARPRVGADRGTLERRELVPFREAARAGVGMMMTAHAVYEALDPDAPATFSERILTGILRDEWDYAGLLVTDSLEMEGAKGRPGGPEVGALRAGVDLLLGPEDPWASIAAVEEGLAEGLLTEEAILESRARVSIVAGDRIQEAPVRKDLGREYAFEIERIARDSLTVAADADGLLARAARSPGEVVGLVLDDDDRPRRSRAFDDRRDDFSGGIIHATREGTGVAGGVAEALRTADLVVMGIFSDVRAGKGRTVLGPELTGFAREVLKEHAAKTLAVVFGDPALLVPLPARNAVLAYGDVPATRRAALDAIFEGGEMPGRPPVRIGPETL